ncbi:MAG: LysR family transcriptional regulator [Rhodospirillaceae bacterium]|nr:LysR family transcriptional regulator [Rhodospirillaceae bacterium]
MNLWHLEVFREVMLTHSVTQAARNLGRTQPAVSASIAGLENDIGYGLFERRGGRLHPVPEAHFLLAEAQQILDRISTLERSMRNASGAEAGSIRIASMPVLAEFFVPRLIARFARRHDTSSFSLISQSSELIYERIASQQYDVGLAELREPSELINSIPIEADCVCALPADDPLAHKSTVTTADLDGRPCATFLPDHFIARKLRKNFSAAGHHFNPRFELQNGAAQHIVVAEKLAYAVFSPLSAWIYRMTEPKQTAIKFVSMEPAVRYRFAVLTPAHRTLSRLAQAFVKDLHDELLSVLAERATGKISPQQALGPALETLTSVRTGFETQ